ncbi:MAG: 4Fe-4S dicluster domain-containing protein [Treponemataceae bacterium]
MAKGRPLITVERCKGCCLCIDACPQKILKMSKDTNRQGVHYPECIDEQNCVACTFCAVMCPDCVIEIEEF